MPLSTGTRLGPYEILSPIGAGGMGEVYKARDTRLDRIVAIKVSKEKFSERFEREARAVAALNHAHICTLHDVGPDYLVMEYIEGTPVVSPNKPEPLPLREALRLAIQIAAALEAAHGKGILHRDLKPSNILVTKSGVKLLDFGLAKFAQPSAGPLDDTITSPFTAAGEIVGTLQYMSPEQLQGQEADTRSDIFSFGLVLYEMLTGRRAFQASSQASLIAAILKEEPPSLTSLQPLTPLLLERTVSKCLEKEPGRRWQSVTDLRDELAWIAESGEVAPASVVSRRLFLPWIGGSAAAGMGAAGFAMWAWGRKNTPFATEATRFRLAPPGGALLARQFTQQSLALSPTGRRVAMIATGERGSIVWVQRLDSLTATPLQGTEGATMVFWSPDGQFIGFWAGGKLKKIAAEGGTPLTICEISLATSATWNQDGIIVAETGGASTNISANSGAIRPGRPLRWARFLPDGKHLLYVNADPRIGGLRAYVAELSTGRETELIPTETKVTFTPDQPGSSQGHVLFGRNATLLALRFDMDKLRIAGEPVPVAKDVPFFRPNGWSEFDTSPDGTLIYSTGSQEAQLTWLDRAGRELEAVGDPRDFFGFFRLSLDGKKLVADVFNFSNGGTDIWVYDLSQATAERVTFGPGGKYSPVWAPDGINMAFGGGRPQGGPPRLIVKAVSDRGSGEDFPQAGLQLPTDWSSDGRWIFYQTSGGEANGEIWVASVADHKLMPLLQSPFDSSFPALSPSREYLAFSANDTSRSEIYVQRFQTGDSPKLVGDRRRVSHDGGNGPRWRRDGKELFFLSPDRQIMAVAVGQGTKIEFDRPAALFRLPTSYRSLAPVTVGYEVSPDGQRFLVPIRKAVGAPLQVVVNWQSALKG